MDEMNCKDCGVWLHAYLDNELDTAAALRVRAHLEGCARCAAELAGLEALRKELRQNVPYHDAPEALEGKVMSLLRAQAQKPSVPPVVKRQWLVPAFSLAALAAALLLYVGAPSAQDQLMDEVVASHVRSLMEQHLTDVASSDKHTVKPWFAGKLDFSLPVYDFAPQGYPLLGGRLDYIEHKTVAALAYKRDKHTVNVFVMPTENADSAIRMLSRRGYNIAAWTQNHLAFEAISDLNAKELEALGNLIAGGVK